MQFHLKLAVSACLFSVLLLYSIRPCWSEYKVVDKDCSARLTALDSHMANYVGHM